MGFYFSETVFPKDEREVECFVSCIEVMFCLLFLDRLEALKGKNFGLWWWSVWENNLFCISSQSEKIKNTKQYKINFL